MKKRISAWIALCLCCLAAFGGVARADILIEPGDAFYARHRDECVFLGRSFVANGADGFVSVKEAPDSEKELAGIENGGIVYLEYSCLYRGDYWGLAPHLSFGWVRIDQLLVQYDCIAFEEEHHDEFYQYEGDYTAVKKAGAALAWPWPGADAPLWTIEDIDAANFTTRYAYQDKQGREWGFIMYAGGYNHIWICISDPMNRALPAFNPAAEPQAWQSDTQHTDVFRQGDDRDPGLPLPTVIFLAAAVAAVAVVTAVLIKIFWKRNIAEETP